MQETVIAIAGSHNATVALSIGGVIKEVVELERLVGVKNASLFSYPATTINHRYHSLRYIRDMFYEKYGIETYDYCYLETIDTYGHEIIKKLFPYKKQSCFSHHSNHAAGSFYQSPHKEALIISFDGGGNDGWFVVYHAERGKRPTPIHYENVNFGVCYSMVGHYLTHIKHEQTYMIGNLVYAGKLMALASYGTVRDEWLSGLREWYKLPAGVDHQSILLDIFTKVGIVLNDDGLVSEKDSLDLAATNQYVFEESFLNIVSSFLEKYENLPVHLTGGSALNIVLNTRLAQTREVFVSPNASDCGLAVGMLCNHNLPAEQVDITYAGPEVFDKYALPDYMSSVVNGADYYYGQQPMKFDRMPDIVSDLVNGKILGVVRGRCEHGPRSLGNRSILANPLIHDMKDIINADIKHRESFRPFAPVVRLEDVDKFFEWSQESRWMSFCPKVKPEYTTVLQSVTHVDGTARVQTVTREQNSWLYNLLTEFEKITGHGILLNTSFNVDGKPILNTYKDAFEVFNSTEMHALVIDDIYISKTD